MSIYERTQQEHLDTIMNINLKLTLKTPHTHHAEQMMLNVEQTVSVSAAGRKLNLRAFACLYMC